MGRTRTRYAAFIRGINVGGRKKLPMEDLRAVMAALGHVEVATYIQSGNVVFTSPRGDRWTLEREIEQQISQVTGLDVGVLVRTLDELEQVMDGNPFKDVEASPTKLHVAFLSEQPGEERFEGIDPTQFEPDQFRSGDRVLYLWCPNGVGKSGLANYAWERRLGVKVTSRNWNTLVALRGMLETP